MRILQAYHIYPALFGGVSAVVYQIAKELFKRGHEINVLTLNDFPKGTNGCEDENGIKVYRFGSFSKRLYRQNIVIPNMEFVSWVKRMMRSYHCIHLHGYRNPYNIVVHHYARKYGVPYISQAHGSLPRFTAKQRLKLIYDVLFGHRLLRDASKVIALSRMEAEQYKGMDVPKEKIEIIPNGIDLSEYDHLPPQGAFKKKFAINENEKIILYLGRIHESKGLDLLAHGFKIVSKDLSNVRLVVVGPDDGYAATFSGLLSDLGVDEKVLLTGFVDKKDKLAALVDSNVFVTPRFRGFPVVFLEACLAGCPIVTTSNELEWIHDNVGYITDSSPIALARAISNVLQDDSILERFRDNCRGAIKNFDISTTTGRLEIVYKSVVNR